MALPLPHVDGVEHRYVDAGDLRMHVAEAGEGEPVLMLHGWPQHWYEWRHLIPPLAERYRVICPDLRGLGWSDAPASGYRKEELAEDIVHLLDELGVDRVRLVGHDWGGYVGFLLCLHHPERVHRYLALNIVHPWPSISVRTVTALPRLSYQAVLAAPGLGAWLLRNRPDLVPRFIRGGSVRRDAWTDEELATFAAPLREPARADASVALYRTFLLCDVWPLALGRYRAMRLRTPTLLLFGMGDPAISVETLRGYEPYADDMTLELVPGVGHFIAEEAPDLLLERAFELFAGA